MLSREMVRGANLLGEKLFRKIRLPAGSNRDVVIDGAHNKNVSAFFGFDSILL